LAEAPFDDAEADLILQSSDKVHFRVFKVILSLASPIFADMFSIPLPPSQKPYDQVHVVPLSEHSTALDVVLRHLYPVPTRKADSLHIAGILAEFARKYQVEALDEVITVYFTDSIERDPVGVYAIAAAYGYNSVGANAARSCLNLPFSGLHSPYLRFATAEHTSELDKYHVACGEAASALALSDRTWLSSSFYDDGRFIPQLGVARMGNCGCYVQDIITPTSDDDGSLTRRSGPPWLWNYLYRSALILAHHPTAEAIAMDNSALKNNNCRSCTITMRTRILEISVGLKKEIKSAVERVSLSLYPLSHVCDVQWQMLLHGRSPYPTLFPWDRVAPLPLQIDRECKSSNGLLL
jgi:hypothetical protein